MLLTAPQDETVSTIAGASVRLHETHDAFARQNCAENRCIWLAMVSSVSPETEHTPAKVMTVSRDSPAATVSDSSAAGLRDDGPSNTSSHQAPLVWRAPEGPDGPGYGAHGRRRRLARHISNTAPQAPPVWRAPEGPEGTGGLRGAAPNEVRTPSLAGGRALRRPEHQRGNKAPRHTKNRHPDRMSACGGARGIRTPDLLIANETRYQLRHSPKDLNSLAP